MSETAGPGHGRLLKVVEVHPDDKVICRAEGCGRGVYKRIHVVDVGGKITVLGSDCFERLYGGGAREEALYGGGSSDGEVRMLSAEERALMEANTVEFIELMRHEYEEVVEAEMQALETQLAAQRQRAQAEAERSAEFQARMDAVAAARLAAQEEQERQRAEKEALERATEEFDPIKRAAIESMVQGDLVKAYQINVKLPGWAGWYRSLVRAKIIEALGKGTQVQEAPKGIWSGRVAAKDQKGADAGAVQSATSEAAAEDESGGDGAEQSAEDIVGTDAGEQASLW